MSYQHDPDLNALLDAIEQMEPPTGGPAPSGRPVDPALPDIHPWERGLAALTEWHHIEDHTNTGVVRLLRSSMITGEPLHCGHGDRLEHLTAGLLSLAYGLLVESADHRNVTVEHELQRRGLHIAQLAERRRR